MDNRFEGIPKLGFGLMRPPMLGKEIDIEQLKVMADMFIAAGFKYFDTAYGYLGGKSEEAVRPVLVERYDRDAFLLATKLPAWAGPSTAKAAKAMFNTSLRRTGAGYFDFYLMHNCGGTRTKSFDDFGIWDYAKEKKAQGLIKHLGFSFHDTADVLDELLTEHPEMEFVQLQINYADWENDGIQSRKCYETAQKHGKPVIIMEPVKGGILASPPAAVAKVLSDANKDVSFPSWALRFAASLDNVITVLSGMSDISQMEDNIKTMKDFAPLDEKERDTINEARAALSAIPSIPCTSCRYCVKGCPSGIPIPEIFSAMNTDLIFNNTERAKGLYYFNTRGTGKASDCIACGQCESVCPQHIGIIGELAKIAKKLEG